MTKFVIISFLKNTSMQCKQFIRLRQNTLSLATGMNGGGAPANFAEIPCCLQQGASFYPQAQDIHHNPDFHI